jgi:hypothetical protein
MFTISKSRPFVVPSGPSLANWQSWSVLSAVIRVTAFLISKSDNAAGGSRPLDDGTRIEAAEPLLR